MSPERVAAPELEPLPLRRLLDLAVEPLRRSLPSLIVPLALPVMTVVTALTLFYLRAMQSFVEAQTGNVEELDAALAATGSLLLMAAAAFLFYVVIYGVLTGVAIDVVAGRAPDVGRAWRRLLEPRILATLVLGAGAIAGSAFFCLLPALVVTPFVALALPAAIDEGLGGTRALRRSFELVGFNPRGGLLASPWLKVAAAIAVTWAIGQALALSLQWPFLVAQQLPSLRRLGGGDPLAWGSETLWLNVPMGLLGAFASLVSWLYGSLVLALLFRELRRRREGDDLERAITRLTAGGEETARTTGAAPPDRERST